MILLIIVQRGIENGGYVASVHLYKRIFENCEMNITYTLNNYLGLDKTQQPEAKTCSRQQCGRARKRDHLQTAEIDTLEGARD